MQFRVSKSEIKQAHTPHNLLIIGLFSLNLLMTPAVLALKIGMTGLLIPLLSTGALIVYMRLRSQKTTLWFVDAHWRLAVKNSRGLLLGYTVTAGLILIAWLVSLTAHEASMKHILWTALTRIALLPTLAGVMVTAIMEASAISLATKQEVPDDLITRFPPSAQ